MRTGTDAPADAAGPQADEQADALVDEQVDEQVVLLDSRRRPVGAAAKATVHTEATPLHLGFSCYLVAADGRVLVTRRALAKRAWPGVWTNAVCGHPAPGEDAAAAVVRRARQELGVALGAPVPVLPEFSYRAVDASGVVENEVCPVFAARIPADPLPDPAEVSQWAWTSWSALTRTARDCPWALSPWAVDQLAEMARLGVRPDEHLP